ncbi:hypothetical protein LTR17_013345 [Elasticomyces elasticus]|nr:hypothetical protein LTR17_013345 [Elasticomyces elasticus]
MAIHPDLPGLEVTIDVKGQPLPEFDEHKSEIYKTDACVKYIEAVSRAEFGIGTQINTKIFPFSDNIIYLEYKVDGEHGTEYQFDPIRGVQYGYRRVSRGAVIETAKGFVQHAMLFSELEVEEGEHDEKLVGKLTKLGTIEVKIYRAIIEHIPAPPPKPRGKAKALPRRRHKKVTKKMATPPPEVLEPEPMPLLPTGQVPEKNVKGLAMSHQTALGPGVPLYSTKSKDDIEFGYLDNDSDEMPFSKVETPPPQPTTRETELVNSQQKVQEIQKEIKKEIKRERDTSEDVNGDDGMEVVEHRNKKVCQTGGRGSRKDVIDLCSDD